MVYSNEEILERFAPQLDEAHTMRFQTLVGKINQAFPHYRSQVVQRELDTFKADINSIPEVRYEPALSTILDLTQQGWELLVQDNELYLRMPAHEASDKQSVRSFLSSERKAQFQDPSVISFIEHMEQEKEYDRARISVRNLIGDPQIIIHRIQDKETPIVAPYIQLVSHTRDKHTGYWLSDIWRYFRYTWSIPYKTMPGRNLFYLVRDAIQPYHPVMGIFALGNSVLNLTVRDDEIGWTVEAIAKQLKRKEQIDHITQQVSGTNGKTVGAIVRRFLETEEEYHHRVEEFSTRTMDALQHSLKQAISELYVKDLDYHRGTKYPTMDKVNGLRRLSEELREQAINNKKTGQVKSFEAEAKEVLFKKKRAAELARLLEAKIIFNAHKQPTSSNWLKELMSKEEGRKAVNVALVANRKTKIGSNMMEIIVCGGIPPYNELLGGKLVSILACSPQVIRDYTEKYSGQVSEIASRMKGKRVIRDSRLAFLGTTSLYAAGSSQYNRITVPIADDFCLRYKKMGITEGYGTVYFSKRTTAAMMRMLELQDGGRRINNIFGEGTSPRFRLISRGLSSLGIRSDAFLKHYSPRIVYSIELARNTNEFLCGISDELDYPFDISSPESISQKTQEMVDFWYTRWLGKRLTSVDIIERLNQFDLNSFLVSATR